jgi:hypothetical protein
VKAGDFRPRTIPGTATFLTSRGEFEHQRFAMIPGWLYALSIGALILGTVRALILLRLRSETPSVTSDLIASGPLIDRTG